MGSPESRVEVLRQQLGYPTSQRDPEGSRFWFLRPGADESEAEETCPIAVSFYSELNTLTHSEILQYLTADDQQREIYGHYTQRLIYNQPVMYLLLPENERLGRVAMILPTEGQLRQRQIQTFASTDEDLQARLNRLKQDMLARTNRMQEKALSVIPLVEWAFYEPIETAKELAKKLAEVSRKIEQAIPAVYEEERQDGYLHTLLTSFQRELLPTLKLKADNEKDYSFADIYAQTIAYGLFTARVFSYTVDERKRQEEQNPERKETDFNRQNAWERLPETNPFLRQLFRDISQQPIAELGEDLVDAIAEVFSILRAAKMDAILADFRAKMNREDIVIRFYEDFLAAYKPQMRERRGVYYTPEPVVSYMVRSVDILLKEKFGKPLGLADPEVMILDPACGTGTFLLWIFQLIHQRFQENPDALTEGLEDRSWSGYVKEQLLPRVFGFELLMAPYAIAHLKLGLFLEETGYQFNSGKRLEIYLTNTLDDAKQKSETLLEEFIAEESNQAAAIKRDKPVMIVIGNPPYSYDSVNTDKWISELIRDYYQVDGQSLEEHNPRGLQDDYVKFIRFGEWRINQSGKGILAFITNHAFLDNPTFRGMRQGLINNFDSLFLYDLHGSIKKSEKQPNGLPDSNVFDIQQGVSILFGLKDSESSIRCSNLYGDRELKYQELKNTDLRKTRWELLSPNSPFYLFIAQDQRLFESYGKWFSMKDIFPTYSTGIVTARDHFAIQWSSEEVWKTVNNFTSLSVEEARAVYKLGDDVRDWKVEFAQSDIRKSSLDHSKIKPVLYRPFDIRYTYFTGNSRGFHCTPRGDVMRNMLFENIAILTSRMTKGEKFAHVQVTELITEKILMSPKTSNNSFHFPLYIYQGYNSPSLWKQKIANLSQMFLTAIKAKLGYSPSPENVFYYIYAVLHSPSYRALYSEFLKLDFPRIPLTGNDSLFRQLVAHGQELVALHLMKSPRLDTLATSFVDVGGDRTVDSGHPKYDESSSSVLINKKGDKFTGVPKTVWEFYIGGYQVCQKWLKVRKGRTLTQEDIAHYQRIFVALQETIHLMQQIDAVIPGWPIE